jgi:hypothetical protein
VLEADEEVGEDLPVSRSSSELFRERQAPEHFSPPVCK